MSDVFLSYASEDRGRVAVIVSALEASGLSVWWDRAIQVGARPDPRFAELLMTVGLDDASVRSYER